MMEERVSDLHLVSTVEYRKSQERTRTRVGTCMYTGKSKGSYTSSKVSGIRDFVE